MKGFPFLLKLAIFKESVIPCGHLLRCEIIDIITEIVL